MNGRLKEIYDQDVADRSGDRKGLLDVKDRERKEEVQKLLREDGQLEAVDFRRAALIFQHGEDPEDFKRANELSKKAIEQGDSTAGWLYAATMDRWLISVGRPQKYGTQFRQNAKGEWELVMPIDPNVTDEERLKYGVPPIAKALEVYLKKYD